MSAMECDREIEIVEAVTCGRWPAGADEELQSHAASCSVCMDVVQVSLTLTQDRSNGLLAARVPSAGLVWWRAEMRARRDAVERATRPMKIVEWTALACVLAAAGVFLYWTGPVVLAELLWQPSLAFFAGLGLLIVLSSVVFYFVLSRD
jgi:hypothetical protein